MPFRYYLLVILAFLNVCSRASTEEQLYSNGPVVQITKVRTRPGRYEDYMRYLDTHFKKAMELSKQAGLVTSYAVYTSEPRGPGDPNILICMTIPDMAVLDKTEQFAAIAVAVEGKQDARIKSARYLDSIREVLGSELIRQLLLR
jgi:hypothetical protein